MMMYALSILFWSIWRRWLGCEGTGPRWIKAAVGAIIIIGSVYCITGFHVIAVLWTVGLLALYAIYFFPHSIYDPDTEGFNKKDPRNWGHWLAKRKLPFDCWSCVGEIYRGALFGLLISILYGLI